MMDNKISAYDAKYKKQFASRDGKDVTAVEKLGHFIDDSWNYSWHWPKDIDRHWIDCVQNDLNTRLQYIRRELKRLESAQKILDRIEA